MFKKVTVLSFLFLSLFSNILFADTKIGVVKLDILFKEIPIYKESQNNLKKQFKPKVDELKKIETAWNKLNDDYLKNERVMSKQDRKEKIKKINETEQKFRSRQKELQSELQTKQNAELQRIRAIVEKAINEYATKNDYDLILRADGTALFTKKYVDITQDIINALN